MNFSRKVAAIAATSAMVLSACGGTATPAPSGGGGGGGGSATGCVVGVSWNNYTEERWAKWDEPAIKAALSAAGATYVSNDAKSSAETQATNVTNLITTSKAKVLIILAQDGTAIKASVAAATAAGIPVIAYDRLIEDPAVLYATFDNVEVGRMQAREVFKAVPKGNYVFIKGNKADANADFLRGGQDEIIKAAVASGDIKNVGETYTNDWKPELAKTEMEQFLTKNSNKVDAVLSENDGMAGGVIAALHDQGLDGKVAVSGQDGDQAALNRVALGTQTVDVWKDSRLLGKTAGDAAVALCKGTKVDAISGAAPFTTPGGVKVSGILLKADPITKANLKDVLDATWITKDALCKDVKAGTVDVCG
ncbi:MAG TPA: substrate-binding domain-containing protein [Verrucomicrobiae bacterium]|jgi:D-xylose transport system substrate-binding protein|nr:substrate-binding domain-containing protein [Verrucomicrobiae bacterium]